MKILDGNTFVVSDETGDIEASLTDPRDLFSFDTRFLSKWSGLALRAGVAPPGKSFVCLEPMTAPTNALRSGDYARVRPRDVRRTLPHPARAVLARSMVSLG